MKVLRGLWLKWSLSLVILWIHDPWDTACGPQWDLYSSPLHSELYTHPSASWSRDKHSMASASSSHCKRERERIDWTCYTAVLKDDAILAQLLIQAKSKSMLVHIFLDHSFNALNGSWSYLFSEAGASGVAVCGLLDIFTVKQQCTYSMVIAGSEVGNLLNWNSHTSYRAFNLTPR